MEKQQSWSKTLLHFSDSEEKYLHLYPFAEKPLIWKTRLHIQQRLPTTAVYGACLDYGILSTILENFAQIHLGNWAFTSLEYLMAMKYMQLVTWYRCVLKD